MQEPATKISHFTKFGCKIPNCTFCKKGSFLTSYSLRRPNLLPAISMLAVRGKTNRTALLSFWEATAQAPANWEALVIFPPYPPPRRRTDMFTLENQRAFFRVQNIFEIPHLLALMLRHLATTAWPRSIHWVEEKTLKLSSSTGTTRQVWFSMVRWYCLGISNSPFTTLAAFTCISGSPSILGKSVPINYKREDNFLPLGFVSVT
jgi:hypothetical protein